MPPDTDFNPAQIATTVSKHDAEFIEVKGRLDLLEQKFKPEQVALVLEAAADDSKRLDKLFSKLFCEMLDKDGDVKKAIDSHIKKSDRAVVVSGLKKWGSFAGAGAIYIAGLITQLALEFVFR